MLSRVSWQRPLRTTSSLKSHCLTSGCSTAASSRWSQPVLRSEPRRLFHLPESETSRPAPSTPRLPSEPFLSLSFAIFIAYPPTVPWRSSIESTCQCRRLKKHRVFFSIPGSGRSPGVGSSSPLQYSCLESFMDRGAWRATVLGVAKSQTRLSMRVCIYSHPCLLFQ